MRTVARSRAFEGRRDVLRAAGVEKRLCIAPPGLLVKIRREESASVAGQHRIDAVSVAPAKMRLDRFAGDRNEGLIGTLAAAHPGLAAHAGLPLVGAGRRVAGLALPDILPTPGKYVFAPGEQGTKECDLVAGRRAVRDLAAASRDLPRRQLRTGKVGESLFERRPLRIELRKAFANTSGFPGMSIRSLHPLPRHGRPSTRRRPGCVDHSRVRQDMLPERRRPGRRDRLVPVRRPAPDAGFQVAHDDLRPQAFETPHSGCGRLKRSSHPCRRIHGENQQPSQDGRQHDTDRKRSPARHRAASIHSTE